VLLLAIQSSQQDGWEQQGGMNGGLGMCRDPMIACTHEGFTFSKPQPHQRTGTALAQLDGKANKKGATALQAVHVSWPTHGTLPLC